MKQLVITILTFLLGTPLCAQSLMDIDADNDGLIEIHNLEMLDAMRYQPDGSGYTTSTEAAKITTGCAIGGCRGYELVRDLDFMSDASYASIANRVRWTVADYTDRSDAGWQMIGTSSRPFNAVFEGNEHSLSNLMINRPNADYVGLFAYTGSSATLVNLALLNTHISGRQFVGSLVAYHFTGRIINSYVTGTIMGRISTLGGLVGLNTGYITNSYVMGNVTGDGTRVGGLVGVNNAGYITKSYVMGNVTGDSINVGGLVGLNTGHITNSYATATVIGDGFGVGGLVGNNRAGYITNSYATGNVTAIDGGEAGGLAGSSSNGSHITNSYATGNVTATGNYAGGLVAQNTNSRITNSYAAGAVAGNRILGGLIARNLNSILTNSYATGTVQGNDAGGLIAQNISTPDTANYWDTQTSGIIRSSGGIGKTTAELQSPTTATGIYTNWSTADWNFGGPLDYPLLRYAVGADTNNPACGVPTQPACGTLLPGQIALLDNLIVANGTVSPPFDPDTLNYDVFVNFDVAQLELHTTASGASIGIRSDTADTEVLSTDTVSAIIPLNLIDGALIGIEVLESLKLPTVYSLGVAYAVDSNTAKPSTPIVVVDTQTIDEGATARLRVSNDYQCGANLRCEWYYRDAASRPIELADAEWSADSQRLSFTVPTDYVETQTTRQLIIVFAARNRGGLASTETTLVITKQDNGPTSAQTIGPPTLSDGILSAPEITGDPDGVSADPMLSYQWQRAKNGAVDLSDPDSWENIDAATATTYALGSTQFPPHRVQIRYTDGQGYENTIYSQWIRDIDADDDGLIEIRSIEELYAIRYQLDGSGSRAGFDTEKILTGCADDSCTGYELTRSLDFTDDASYTTLSNRARWTVADYTDSMDAGWEPIGTNSEPFNAIFEGNGHTLSNLMINRPATDYVGLFAYTGSSATLVNLPLSNAHIKGNSSVGGLVANNMGEIANSYAMATVAGSNDIGGLVGNNMGGIANSYAMATVAGSNDIGGLVGNNMSDITNSYATGAAEGTLWVGGLVGINTGSITNSYATGTVEGSTLIGGLVGENIGGSITTSYWDRQTSGITVSSGGTSQTTAELRSPTTATGIYQDWSTANWDFSRPSHYPLLRYAVDADSNNPTCGVSSQPTCGDLLPDQISFLDNLVLINGTVSPLFDPDTLNYDVLVNFDVSQLELHTTATAGSSLRIRDSASDTEVLSTDTASAIIPLNLIDDTLIGITVVKGLQIPTVYSLSVAYAVDGNTAKPSTPIVVVDNTQPIGEGATARLRVRNDYQCGAELRCEWYYRDAASRLIGLADAELSADSQQLSFTVPTDYTETQTTRQLIIVFAARNRGGLASTETTLVITRQDNGPTTQIIDPPTFSNEILSVPEITQDPDGVSADPMLSYQWQRAKDGAVDLSNPNSWENIDGATATTYSLAITQFTPHRVQIRYTDAQGYENTIYSQWIRDIDADDDGLIEIRSIEELHAIRYQLDGSGSRAGFDTEKIVAGCTDGGCTGYELARDLDFMDDASYATASNRVRWTVADYTDSMDAGWEPIGTGREPFNAFFEGNGHTLSNLMINRPATDFIGLFGSARGSATLVNLALLTIHIRGDRNVGGLVGQNAGRITDSYATGTVTGMSNNIGGLVGQNTGHITDSHATATVTGIGNDIGGLVGFNVNRITSSYATGTVTGTGINTGGLAGSSIGHITNSYATGTVEGVRSVGGLVGSISGNGKITSSYATATVTGIGNDIGGLVGDNNGGRIINSYATGTATGMGNNTGGLVGDNNDGRIINSHATGTVEGGDQVGGLVGSNKGHITNSYAAGTVEGVSQAGGLVGENRFSSRITNSYATGTVEAGHVAGGLVGWNEANITNSYAVGTVTGTGIGGLVALNLSSTITASYWDTQTSGIAIGLSGTSKTTVELQSPTTATGIYLTWSTANWDFSRPSLYPLLRYAVGTDPSNPACGVPSQPICGTLLPHQLPSLLLDLVVANGTVSPPFDPETMNYEATVAFDATQLELHTTATGASIGIRSDTADTEVLSSNTASALIPLNLIDATRIRIEVIESLKRPTVYSLGVVYAVDSNTAKPSTPIVVVDTQTIGEGATVALRVRNDYQCGADLRCEWYYRDAASQSIELADAEWSADSLQLRFTVPTDYTETQTTRQLIIVFAARNRGGLANTETTFVITRQNNGHSSAKTIGPPTLSDEILSAPEIREDPDGVSADPMLSYQWQRAKDGAADLSDPDSWENIDGATATTYTLVGTQFPPYRVQIRYTDNQGYENTLYSQWIRDIDADDDGLIEIRSIEELHAIRYQLDGSGTRADFDTEKIVAGCADGGCTGYELTRDLDFMDDANYATASNRVQWTVADYTDSMDTGWEPIGTSGEPFNAIFEGNGHTLSNLMINRSATNDIGLFTNTERSATLANLALLNIHIRGNEIVGGLVSQNNGRITDSYATGTIEGQSWIGGLVGWNTGHTANSYATGTVTGAGDRIGSLVGWNTGNITNSYATGTVEGRTDTGGLAGRNQGNIINSHAMGTVTGTHSETGGVAGYNDGDITNSYATGTVTGGNSNTGGLAGSNQGNITNSYATGTVEGGFWVGGLVGQNGLSGNITNSYATGIVEAPGFQKGGLVGRNLAGTILTSYWDTQASGIASSFGGTSKTTVELQSPTMATGIYLTWSTANWDFSRPSHYPLLRHTVGADPSNPACGVPTQPDCGTLLPYQLSSLLLELVVANGTVSPPFDPETLNYDATVAFDAAQLELHTTATGASIGIRSDTADTEVLSTDTASALIPLNLIDATRIRIDVMESLKLPTMYSLSVAYAVDGNTAKPSTPIVVVDSTQPIGEGATVALRIRNDYQCGADLRCEWYYRDAASRLIELPDARLSADSLQLNFTVPTDYTETQTTRQLIIVFAARNRGGLASTETTLVITRQDNGPTSAETVGPPTLIDEILSAPEITQDPDGVSADPMLSYQWQRAKDGAVDLNDPDSWENIDGATATTYTLVGTQFPPHRVRIRYTDGQGYENTIYSQWIRDIDADDDGLIEIESIEELHAIRYQLDGSGTRADFDTEKIIAGCADDGCKGYELTRDLDFMDDASYAIPSNRAIWTVADYTDSMDVGWEPIGTGSEPFNTIFEGNGHTLSNLMINRSATNDIGLFGGVSRNATLANLALLTIHIRGNQNVGGLAGSNDGNITNSQAAGAVTGMQFVGGLVGSNTAKITNSYATGTVTDSGNEVGGLVGRNTAKITNSYATGTVEGALWVGGLVGWNNIPGNITNSYATGIVDASRIEEGGLVGLNLGSTITASYWDTQASGVAGSRGGIGKTTVELQSPTTATGIYRDWSTANWDFSRPSHYPLLRYAVGADPNNPTCGVPTQPICGTLLPHQLPSLLTELVVANGTLSPPFDPETVNYEATVAFDATQLELHTTATGSSIGIRSDTADTEVLSTHIASAVIPLNLIDDTRIRIEVIEGSQIPTVYSLGVVYAVDNNTAKPPTPIVVVDSPQTVGEGATVALHISNDYQCGAELRCEWYYRDAASRPIELADAELSADSLQLSFTAPTDYTESQTTRQLIIVFAARNRGGLASAEATLMITRQDNGPTSAEIIGPPTFSDEILIAPEIREDPDGVSAEPKLSYQWQRAKDGAVDLSNPNSWENIDGATAITYTLAGTQFPPHRVQIRYTDGQGYENTIYSQWIRDIDADDDGLIEIRSIEELHAIRYQLDGSGSRTSFDAKTIRAGCAIGGCTGYELIRDLDFMDDASYATASNRVRWTVADYADSTDAGWEPIGTDNKPFNAIFEGNGHILSNLMINRSAADDIGLFGSASRGTILANLALLTIHIRGDWNVGGLVGWNAGRIANSHATGTVEGEDSIGGLVGSNTGHITNSYATGTVEGKYNIGGLVGTSQGDITNSYATGTVTGMNNQVGGLVGSNTGHITDSYAMRTVTSTGNKIGGLVGSNEGHITGSYATGTVTSTGDEVGGLVGSGRNTGHITNSYATGTVEGKFWVGGLIGENNGRIVNSHVIGTVTGMQNVGGLAGNNDPLGSITNSYATGTVTGINDIGGLAGSNRGNITNSYATGTAEGEGWVGGLVGQNQSPGNITNSYATGIVEPPGFQKGGLVGRNFGGTILTSYWDIQASGITVSSGGTSKTTVELQSPTTATGIYLTWSTANWDFSRPSHYPLLKYAVGADPNNPACGMPSQPICGTLLPYQLPSLLLELVVANGTVSPPFDPETLNYDATVAFEVTQLELHTTATGASISIRSDTTDTEVLSTNTASALMPLNLISTLIRIEVIESLKRPTVYSLNVAYTVDDNTAKPSTPIVVVDSTQPIAEGDTVALHVSNDYQCSVDLRCEWYYRDAASRPIALADAEWSADSLQLSFTVPTGYTGIQTTRQLIIVFAAHNRGGLASAETTLVIIQQDNGTIDTEAIAPPTLSDDTLSAPKITDDPDGVSTDDPELRYQWQRAKNAAVDLSDSTNWENIDAANAPTYTLTAAPYIPPYRVRIRYRDAQGYENTFYSQWIRDIDADDDGLIEIRYLEELHTMRYQLDGSGTRTNSDAKTIRTGCVVGGCKGYELLRDMDFMDDASYATTSNRAQWTVADYTNGMDTGWGPIGTRDEPFDAIFEGNNYIISNLMINRSATNSIGLFGGTGSSATVVNLSLLNTHIRGNQYVGSLVGWNEGRITNSYATGTVSSADSTVGSLVGWNEGRITNSYATGTVTGSRVVGGLVGQNTGDITNSYAMGNVTSSRNHIGGLVGQNAGNITNSYAMGNVKGARWVGGLVGSSQGRITNSYATGIIEASGIAGGGLVGLNLDSNTIIIASYWDTQTSGIGVSDGGIGKTTAELQSPTMATGIYSDWSTADWYFSKSSLYPLLRYAVSADPSNPTCGVPTQPICGTLLSAQINFLDNLVVTNGTLSPPFDPDILNYEGLVNFDATRFELRAVANEASLRIRSSASDTEVLGSDTVSAVIPLNLIDDPLIDIEVIEDSRRPTVYSLGVTYAVDDNTVKPSIPVVADSPQTINEGAAVELRVSNDYQCGADLRCEWYYRDAASQAIELADAELSADSLQLNFTVPTDYTETQTTRQLIIVFAARNRGGLARAETAFVIIQRDNGSIAIGPPTLSDNTFSTSEITKDPDGLSADVELSYQWQRTKSAVMDLSEPTSWENIDGATEATYTLSTTSYISPHRIQIRYTDAQDYENTLYSEWFIDIDADDDGLIEIIYMEELNAIRYQLDGSGSRASSDAQTITSGCADSGCRGYELLRDLDFTDDANYISTSNKALWTVADYENSAELGWEPIGTSDDAFDALFEGNGHTLSNLMINRPAADYVGLFGDSGSVAMLANLGLLTGHIKGNDSVGSLAGRNTGHIANSYASGTSEGNSTVGGLVGENAGRITNSYATGAVKGIFDRVGGLVAWNVSATIENSYATGPVEGNTQVGGLVAQNFSGRITNSYATGTVEGNTQVGGLVAQNLFGNIRNSYWDRQTSGLAVSDGGISKTTTELQSPTTATGIYRDWSTADWDFSKPSYYPLIRYTVGADLNNPTCSVFEQPTCGTLLPTQFPGRSSLNDLAVANGTISPPFDPDTLNYNVTVTFDVTQLELQTTAIGSSLRIHSNTANTEVLSTDTASAMLPLSLVDNTLIYIEVIGKQRRPTVYSLSVAYTVDEDTAKPPTPIIVVDTTQPIAEGATAALRISNDYRCSADLQCEWYSRDAASHLSKLADTQPNTDPSQLSFTVPTDYTKTQTPGQLTIVFAARNRGGLAIAETVLMIMRRENGPSTESITPPIPSDDILRVPKIDLAADPDGINAAPSIHYQWQRAKSDAVDLSNPDSWENIDGATATTYTLTTQFPPYRVQIRYTDGQGYENTVYSRWLKDIDADDDGLIEIESIEELNAVRYQLDGSGTRTSAAAEKLVAGCADSGCRGYELLRDLDFMSDASYTSTSNKALWTVSDYENSEETGWEPIGTSDDTFNALFEGNGHTLSNLMINRPATNYVGLFGDVGSSAMLVNLGLLTGHIKGNDSVGGLVGRNAGHIANSYASGSSEGNSIVGGLVGENTARITNSYATATVKGMSNRVGGLVAWNVSATIENSYATGTVEGNNQIGGLVGVNFSGRITNSYATGTVEGNAQIGGLVAQNILGSATNSYWDRQTSGLAVSDGGASKTTAELQSLTTATGIYRDWSTADWDFSPFSYYPLLKYTVATESDYAACGLSEQPICGALLPNQFSERSLLEDLVVANASVSPPFNPRLVAYDIIVAFDTEQIELRTTATAAVIHIRSDTLDTEVRSTDTASATIPLDLIDDTVIRIDVVKGEQSPEMYSLTVSYDTDDSVTQPSPPIFIDATQTIDEGTTATLQITNGYQCDAELLCRWSYHDAAPHSTELLGAELSTDSLQLSFTVPTDYIAADHTSQQLVVVFTARNRGGTASTETSLVIRRRDNGPIDAKTLAAPTLVGRVLHAPEIDLADDPDGVNDTPAVRYQWQRAKSGAVNLGELASWDDIEGATGTTYTPSDNSQTIPYRLQISYTDGQGYLTTIYSKPTETQIEETGLKIRLRVFLEAPL